MLSLTTSTILKELCKNGRRKFVEISDSLNISKKTVWNHYKLLKQKGIIVGSTIQLNYRKVGFDQIINIYANVKHEKLDQYLKQLLEMPNIYSVFPRCPKYNIGIIALLKNITELDNLRYRLRQEIEVQDMIMFNWLDVKNFVENLNFNPNLEKNSNEHVSNNNLKHNRESQKPVLDKKDKSIIEKLGVNSRISFRSLSKELEISQDTVTKRYNKLVEKQIIKSVIQINPKKLGYNGFPHFHLSFSSKVKIKQVIDYISSIPDIIHIIVTSGEYDLVVYAFVKNIEHFLEIKGKIENIDELAKMQTNLYGVLNIWPTPKQYISTF